MDEGKLIKKIKELRQIKPSKDWASLTKNRILGRELEKSETSPFSILFAPIPIRKPVFIVAPLILVAAALGGLFVYLNLGIGHQLPLVVGRLRPTEQKAEEMVMVSSLKELQVSLEKVMLGLNNLKKAKDPNQALVMTEIVKATAKNGEEIVDQIKSLASLGDAYRELGEKASNTQIEMMGDYIEYLSQRSLTEEDEARLQKAEEYYNEGKYTEAMILIQRIGNN